MKTGVSHASHGQSLLDAIAAAGFSALGSSRQGRAIAGRLFEQRAAALSNSDPGDYRGAGPPVRLLFFGAIHGDEPASAEALLELAQRMSAAPANTTRASVMIIPALNPDGLLLGSKNSSSDVDLNRNFPARNFVREHAPGYHPGPFPLSEPETSLLARIIDQEQIKGVVAVHAPFGCVNFDGPARPWADAVAESCGWPVRENIGYPTPGSLGSWLGIDRNIPVLTLELPPGPLAGFRASAAAALDCASAGPAVGALAGV